MDIGNLLNDPGRSPQATPASLSDSRPMNDTKPRRDVAHDRQNVASDMTAPMQHSQLTPPTNAYAPHQQYNAHYSLQTQMQPYAPMTANYASYPSTSQPLHSLGSPAAIKQEGSVTSATSDTRGASAHRQGSEGDVKDALPKNFGCSTCSKQFARRSDLVRHERIHSGVRPHKCTWPYCNKQFIQRSALTVHERVHSGEKPHMCEKCSKQFSDSSSLARHRRIHSGKRPYKCPFPDCQKTFTRRTTLTRHQNNHNGTLEEAAAARAAALASHASQASVDSSEQPENSESASPPQHHSQQPHHLMASSLQQQQQQPPPPQQAHQSAYPQAHGSQSYYATGQPSMGQAGPHVTAGSSSRSLPTSALPSAHQYRPALQSPFNPAAGQGQEHSQSTHSGVGPPHEGYHSYQDPRYASNYQPSFYHHHQQQQQQHHHHQQQQAPPPPQPQQQQQHHQQLRHPSAHEGGYDPHGQMGVGWNNSMS